MAPKINLATRLAFVFGVLLAIAGAGYVLLHRELTAISIALEHDLDSSLSMLHGAYEMEIIVTEIAAGVRRGTMGVLEPRDDPQQKISAFSGLLDEFLRNARNPRARKSAGQVRELFDVFVEHALATTARVRADPKTTANTSSLVQTFALRDDLRALIHGELQRAAANQFTLHRAEFSERLNGARRRLSLFLGLAALLGVTGSFVFVRGVVKPVKRLANALRTAGAGNFDFRLEVRGHDELADLTHAFNEMSAELQRVTVSRALLDDILGSITDGVFVIDPNLVIRSCNHAAAALIGIDPVMAEGETLERFLPACGTGVLLNGKSLSADLEAQLHSTDGVTRPVSLTVTPLNAGAAPRFVCAVTDITRRKLDEQALLSSHEELRSAYIALQRVQEDERRAIAREVHDEFGAVLTVMNSTLFLLGESVISEPSKAQGYITQLSDLIAQASAETERIVDGLYPPILDHFGLVPALEWYATSFQQWTRIDVHVSAHLESAPDVEIALAIFRLVQEALTNAAKHSGADRIMVSLEEKDNTLVLRIDDNGRGCNEALPGNGTGQGLRGLRERVGAIGGALDVQETSALGGFRIVARLPLRESEHLPPRALTA